MLVIDRNRYRILRLDEGDYLVDISSYWWNYFGGVLTWHLPLCVYKVNNGVQYSRKLGIKIKTIVEVVVLLFCIYFSAVMKCFDTESSVWTRLFMCCVVFFILAFLRVVTGRREEKKFLEINNLTESEKIKARLIYAHKKTFIKCLATDIFLQGIFGLLVPLLYVTQTSANELFPLITICIWIFLCAGEWTKAPFALDDVTQIRYEKER